MQLRNTTLVWSAVGLLAVGTATGLSALALLQPAAPTANRGRCRLIQSATRRRPRFR